MEKSKNTIKDFNNKKIKKFKMNQRDVKRMKKKKLEKADERSRQIKKYNAKPATLSFTKKAENKYLLEVKNNDEVVFTDNIVEKDIREIKKLVDPIIYVDVFDGTFGITGKDYQAQINSKKVIVNNAITKYYVDNDGDIVDPRHKMFSFDTDEERDNIVKMLDTTILYGLQKQCREKYM